MCCSPVTSTVFIFLSLPTILKGSLDSLYFVFLQSIFYLLFLETAHCKVINYPPIAETNHYLPVWFCTLPLGCCLQLLWETVLCRLQWLPALVLPLACRSCSALYRLSHQVWKRSFPRDCPQRLLFSSVHSIRLIISAESRTRLTAQRIRCCDISHTLCGWLYR